MKKIALSIMAIAIAFASIAQENKKGRIKGDKDKAAKAYKHERKDLRGEKVAEKLNLTDAQKAQLKSQNEQFKNQMDELKNSNLSDDQKKERRQEILKARREQMQAILTPEQREQAKGIKKDIGKKRGDKVKGREKSLEGRRDGGEKMKEELGLTDAQASKLKTINENFRTTVKSIRTNEALTQDQKREQMKNAQLKHKEDIGSLLTTEQKDRMKNRPNRRSVK